MPCTLSASPTPSSTVMVGFSAALGSWNTIWISRRISRSRRAAHRGDVLPLEEDGAVGRGSETQQRAPQRGLAAAALADQAHDLAPAQLQGDSVDRLDGP